LKEATLATLSIVFSSDAKVYTPLHNICGACIFLPPGRMPARCSWFAELKSRLLKTGLQVIEFFHPANDGCSTEEDVQTRLYQLKRLTTDPSFYHFKDKFTILGLSLGGQVALRYVSMIDATRYPQPKRLVLCSTVIDSPTPINAAVKSVGLIYGQRDAIAYVSDGKCQAEVIKPNEYSKTSLSHLITTRSQMTSCYVLEGCGHFLIAEGEDHNKFLDLAVKNLQV